MNNWLTVSEVSTRLGINAESIFGWIQRSEVFSSASVSMIGDKENWLIMENDEGLKMGIEIRRWTRMKPTKERIADRFANRERIYVKW